MRVSRVRFAGVMAIMVFTLTRLAGAAAPTGHYVVTAGSGTGNGTVYDTKSKLTWQQTVSSTTYTWSGVQTYCAGVGTSLGGTGWRLPTVKELYSLVDLSQTAGPYIDPTAFPSTPSDSFWSSSPVASSPSRRWVVEFDRGDTYASDVSLSYTPPCHVRCVR
jgi:Protein of unknown function (DUF1566)